MKKFQKNLRGSFNVFSNSARQLEVPLRSETLVQSGNWGPPLDAQGGLDHINVMTKAVKDSMIDTYRRCAVVAEIKPLSLLIVSDLF